ncbi:PREDICTED: LOW QUALITY PROTEIN: zonadhesin [Capra hircus]|uniref:LOW QUALITY PROTEIN: zonadhesin n=1 Tax=Capra hircus TaxID=9925 RepID=UPI0008466684|nr:PREDICTED: LOW QUALITY PROTEIN: zonadhesin [Capra hircus]
MAPPVWTLVLLLGAAWARKEKPPDWKPLARSSRENSILTQCDFEDDSRPLCDWSQVTKDDGDWTRESRPSFASGTAPPGGYPSGEGYYLHMDSSAFHPGGVARLRSPAIWEQGPLCVRFAFYMFGLSWGAQLKLWLASGTKGKHPNLLWKHVNTQSPSWIPTAVTVPLGLVLPSRLTFEGVWGSTTYLDIALDAISIHRGSCNRVCLMQTCNFDTLKDLCGWSWISTASGAKWVQKKGPTGVLDVGPEGDFSSPGDGYYMLLDPKNAKASQKSVLLSPLIQSSGCLSLSFHYVLRGRSPGAGFTAYASVLGSIRKHTIFSGQPGPNWQPVSVNYTGQGQIQFTLVGVFAKIPEPAVAVDAISIAPCGESFPQCDFEDKDHPFCDWVQVLQDGGRWTQGSANTLIHGTGPFGISLSGESHFVYLEADKFSQEGQSYKLVSRPFCAPGAICVAFSYHMDGRGKGTKLRLLLGSPAGSPPSSLWERVGSQGPDWLNDSMAIPSGHQQPMQLMFEVERGSHAAFVVALGFIFISQGTCRGRTGPQAPEKGPRPPTGPSETPAHTEKPVTSEETSTTSSEISPVPTEKPVVPSEKLTVPTERPTVPPEKPTILPEGPTFLPEGPTIPTEKPTVPTEKTTIPTEKTTIPTEKVTVPTEKTTIPTNKTTIPTEKPTILTEEPTFLPEWPLFPSEWPPVPTEKPMVPTERTTIPTEKTTIPTEKSTVPTEKTTIPTEKTTVHTKKSTISTEKTTICTEKTTVPTEKTTVSTEKTTIPTEKTTIPTEKSTVPTEKTTISTEKTTIPTEKTTIPTEKTTIPTEKTTIPTEKTTIPTEKTTIPTEKSTVPTEKTTISTEKTTIPTEKTTIPTEKTTVPTEKTTVSTEKTTIPTEKTTIPTEKTTVPTEKTTVSTEKTTIPTEKTTIPTEKSTVPTEKTTISTEKNTIPTEKTTIPTEKTTISTEKTTVPTKKTTIPTEKTTIPTEKTTISTEKTTVPTEKTTISTEKTTVPTKKTTIPTEKTTVPTEKSTIPTKKTTIPTEKTTVPTKKTTIPTEKPTVPTERPTTPMTPQPSPALVPTQLTVFTMPSTSMTPVTPATTTTPRPTPAMCPPNAHYERCACPASCQSPKPACGLLCKPGCVCNSGFLFHDSRCINASSCDCFYNENYYKTGTEWFSPNCTERCRCQPGSQIECEPYKCGTHTVCQLKHGQYRCHPYDTATCFVYGDPHYFTFDGRYFNFRGKCTYLLAQPCGNSTEPFFRVTVKNEERGLEGVSCLSKVSVTLSETTITLLKGRHTLVGGQRVTLPAIPSGGVFLTPSGRFVQLQTAFGLRVRWDGDQQLYVRVPSTYSSKLCGFCGNYDGDSSNDNKKPDGKPARDEKELGNSWQTSEDEDQTCQENQASLPSCDTDLKNTMSRPEYCGRLVVAYGAFQACLPHLRVSSFFDNCLLDMCNFQGLQQVLCTHMSALTETCQEAGYAVKPWRGPQFCPLACPPNSRYTLCAKLCPDTCHSTFSGMACQNRCVEGCECNPGFILSGLQCVPQSECGCLDPTAGYFKVGERWFKPGCRRLCICEGTNRTRCVPWQCQAQELCGQQDGTYGCHPQGSATCTVWGDPHYLTFDGALHHFMGTCTYILTRPCSLKSLENYFFVSATNEFRGGNLEASYVKAVQVQAFGIRVWMLKGLKVMLDGRQVALPLWFAHGRMTVRSSGSFILLYTDFGLQVRYDGYHLVEVTAPSSYAGRLCGMCGNYNNNSLDDNLQPDKRPAVNSVRLGASWKLNELSESGCFAADARPPRCLEKNATDPWSKNCDILVNPQGPFSRCHKVVAPQASFTSCVYGQCGTKGDAFTLCRSLQAYASLCARAGQVLTWRSSTFCPLKCPSGSRYSPCADPCPATCLSLSTPSYCPSSLPCAEGCECQRGHILSGTTCVPLSECGCTSPGGAYHSVGERWYTDKTCSRLCTCSIHNNVSCFQTACKPGQMCWPRDGLMRCRGAGMGVCQIQDRSRYISFDGSYHAVQGACTYVLAKTCHSTMDLPFFKISGKNGQQQDQAHTSYLRKVYVHVFNTLVTLKKDHVLINGTWVPLPATSQIRGVSVFSRDGYMVLTISIGVEVKFDGNGFLKIEIPKAYYGKTCGVCGNFNGEEEDELLMPNDELAPDDITYVDSWQDKEIDPSCRDDDKTEEESEKEPETTCQPADLERAQEQCQAAFQTPGWARCASRVILNPFLVRCTNSLCEFGGLSSTLCQSLQAFATACQAQGIRPPIWRNSSFCPLDCPPHYVYTNCFPHCPPTCDNPEGRCKGSRGPSNCEEGCVCEPGYVLKERQCVPRSQCGCRGARGRFLPEGNAWFSSSCSQRCTCQAGAIQCRAFACPASSRCETDEDGKEICKPYRSERCTVYGDPTYRTFDGLGYRFQGRMTYYLVKTVDVLPSGVEPFIVEGRNKMYASHNPIFLHEIIVMVYGYTVQLQHELELVVNGQKVTAPYEPVDQLRVSLRSDRLFVITDFELVVSFNGKNNAVISLPVTYRKLVLGLCGNCDQNKRNDFMLPNGAVTQNLLAFGNSWEVKMTEGSFPRISRAVQEEEVKEDAVLGFPGVSGCRPEELQLISRTQACGALVDPEGPFAVCHQTVAPEPFLEHCVSDLCATHDPKEQEELRCQVLSGLVMSSQYCLPELYDTLPGLLCHTGSPPGLQGPLCGGLCQPPGLHLQRSPEPPLAHCGCTNNGIYYQQGDSFVNDDCSQRCTCARTGLLLCEPLGCSPGEVCTLGNRTRGCFRDSPCLQNPCQNDGRCREQGTHFTCECEPGYGGDRCMEPRDVPPPEKPASSFASILLPLLVPMVVIVLVAVTRGCISRRKGRREKTQSQTRGKPPGAGPRPFKVRRGPIGDAREAVEIMPN